jgi:hypothetical protein
MATFTFRQCIKLSDGSYSQKTKAIAYSKSVNGNKSLFVYDDFLKQYLICINSYYQLERFEDYYHTPTNDIKDCNILPEPLIHSACLSALCGINFGNTQCDWTSAP